MIEAARCAKRYAADTLAFQRGIVGIGLTQLGDSYAIKINVDSTVDLASIPSHFLEIPVVVDMLGSIVTLDKS